MVREMPENVAAAPAGVDLSKPSAARVYDWYLGGRHNWAIDRDFGRAALERFPVVSTLAWHNRLWLQRVIRAALDAGITQFIDLGSGVPTVGNVHEIVHEHAPDSGAARVVYVDYEPVAVAHADLILRQQGYEGWAGVLQADLRFPRSILASSTVRELIDFTQPVCLLAVGVLHFVGDQQDVPAILSGYRDHLASGSWLAVSHLANDAAEEPQASQVRQFAEAYQGTTDPVYLRTRDEIIGWYDTLGLSLLEPGIVAPPEWGSTDEYTANDGEAIAACGWCGVGTIPDNPT